MKKTICFVFTLALSVMLPSCKYPLSPEVAASVVLEGERERIPLYIQEYELTNLTIDSLCLLNEVEPMSALLYTTWTYDEITHAFLNLHMVEKKTPKTQTFIIQVDGIKRCEENSDLIQWNSNWDMVNIKLDRETYEW